MRSPDVTRSWRFLKEQLARIRGSLARRAFEKEAHEELQAHLDLLAERYLRNGLTPSEARHAAQKQFGGIAHMKNELRDRGRFRPLEALIQDCAYVLRQLRRSPVFALAAILTLALGIGANTAIFTLVDQLILRLLPIQDPQRVVALSAEGQFYGDNMGYNALSYPMYETMRDHNQVFTRMMCRRPVDFTVTARGQSDVLSGELVSGNYFPLLGVKAALGRLFDANDDLHVNAHPVVVLSYAYWASRFGANPRIIGQSILVNNYAMTVIGVAQPGFAGVEPGLLSGLFVPMMMTPALFPNNDIANMFDPRLRWLNAYGRLKPGETREHAKAGLQPLFHQILDAEILEAGFVHATPYEKAQYRKMWLNLIPGGQGNTELKQQYEKPLWMLMGVTTFVLLIACANLASLLAARAMVRQKEIAVRLAIGSSRARIIQQLLTESMLIALAGGAAGVLLAIVIVKGLLAFLPENPANYTISSLPDLRILCFALALSLFTGILFGLIPALEAVRPNIAETLKAKVAAVAGAGSQVLFRKLLVAAQITLSLLLLIGASLFIRTLANLRSVNPGFEVHNIVQFELSVGSIGYSREQSYAFFGELERRLNQLPGVESAGIGINPVLHNSGWASLVKVPGHPDKPGSNIRSYMNAVSPGYFKTLGIRLLSGRFFRESDTADSPKVVIANQTFADYYFGHKPAVGHFIGRGYDASTPMDMQIVGVVSDTDSEDLREQPSRQLYLCAPQAFELSGIVYLKVKGDLPGVLASARRLVQQMEPKAPITNVKTMERQLEESLGTERMIASLSTGFTILAVMLAVLGLYGVMAYMVTQRAKEIGIRVALGALFGNVVWLVMREVVLLVAAGIAIAIPLALALARLIAAELYGIQPTDPLSIALAALLLSAIAALAGFIPARRAASADPLEVLRYE